MTTTKKLAFIPYAVTGEGKDAFWTRIGSVWQHSHGEGLGVELNALPVNGPCCPVNTDRAGSPSAARSPGCGFTGIARSRLLASQMP